MTRHAERSATPGGDQRVARVFRRALELDAGAEEPRLDEEALVEIGAELGLSPRAVRQAVREIDGASGAPPVRPRGLVGPRAVVLERTLPMAAPRAHEELAHYLDGALLQRRRWTPDRSRWQPREGVVAHITRRFRVPSAFQHVTRVDVAVTEAASPGGRAQGCGVRVEAQLATVRNGSLATAGSGLTLAGTIGGLGLIGAITGEPAAMLALPPAAAMAAGSVLGARRVYRRWFDEVEVVLQGALDTIAARGAWFAAHDAGPASAWAPPVGR